MLEAITAAVFATAATTEQLDCSSFQQSRSLLSTSSSHAALYRHIREACAVGSLEGPIPAPYFAEEHAQR